MIWEWNEPLIFFSGDVTIACCLNIKRNRFGRRKHESDLLLKGIIFVLIQLSLTDDEDYFHLMSRLHVASTSNELALDGDRMKVIYYRRASCQYSDNQITTGIQVSFMDYEGLFHLMLLLQVVSKSNEITLFGDRMKSDLLLTGIMSETPTIEQRLTINTSYGL